MEESPSTFFYSELDTEPHLDKIVELKESPIAQKMVTYEAIGRQRVLDPLAV